MTETPAGWYPDANGEQRYWDGNAWTEHTAPAEGAAQPAQPAQPPAGGTPGYAAAPAAGGAYGGQGHWQPTEYLEGAGSDFQGAIKGAVENITQFEGRASRSSFWWFALGLWIVGIVLSLIARGIGGTFLSYVVSVLVFLVALTLSTRRLHDTDRSGWWNLLYLAPCVGFIILIVFWVMPSTQGPNKYNNAAR